MTFLSGSPIGHPQGPHEATSLTSAVGCRGNVPHETPRFLETYNSPELNCNGRFVVELDDADVVTNRETAEVNKVNRSRFAFSSLFFSNNI